MKRSIIQTAILVFCLALSVTADVVIESKTEMNMIGAGQIDMKQMQYIKGDRSYDQSTTSLTGAMASMTGNKEMVNVQIVRLDKGVGWVLDPGKKSYMEFSFEDMKKQLAQAREQNKDSGPMGEYEWKTDVFKNIGTEAISGHSCQGIRAVSVGVKKSDPKDSVFITNEQWFSKDLPGGAEFSAFSEKMASAMGTEKGFLNQMSMNPMLAKYSDQFSEIADAFKAVEGVPLKTVLIVEGTVNPMSEAMNDETMDEETKEMMKKMGMSMSDAKSKGGRTSLVTMTSTVTRIDKESTENIKYEIPEGFTKR
jgi:hypothetical protein